MHHSRNAIGSPVVSPLQDKGLRRTGPVTLVFGGGGKLGRQIVDALLKEPARKVRVGLRNDKHSNEVRRWAENGAEIVTADLDDIDSLMRACETVTTVVSAVQGGPETMIDGQFRLLNACLAQGVTRLVPSDFSMNFFTMPSGINPYCDMKRVFAKLTEARAIGCTHILTGGFMDVIFSFPSLIDQEAATITYWGDGDMPIDFTTSRDVASYVAATIEDPDMWNATLEVAGDRQSIHEIANIWEAATGRKLRRICLGSIKEGYAKLARMASEAKPSMEMMALQFVLPMMSGVGSLSHIRNSQYPQVSPTSLRTFFETRYAKVGA